jgi:cytochrome c peroxidase
MRVQRWVGIAVIAGIAITAFGQGMGRRGQGMGPPAGMGPGMHMGMFAPLPDKVFSPANPLTPEKIQLGRMLYFDTRLSSNRDVSCNSCHDLATYGVDHSSVSTGEEGQHGTRNAPSVYNAALHVAQFWDARAPDVEEQAKGPVLNPKEMAMKSPAEVETVLRGIPGYVTAFRAAFPGEAEPVTFDNMGKAIAAFERVLVTPSRWDKFLKGDSTALSSEEQLGFTAFRQAGCAMCHNGPTIGATSFQQLGRVKPWPDTHDQGRFEVTGNPRDRMVFKVPSLRNVEMTAPYFHDGSVKTLEEAIRMMGEHQLGIELTPQNVSSIAAWLRTLTGELPTELITAPELPTDAG